MKKLSAYLLYFLAFLLPFGSVNPFNLSAVVDVNGRMSEQMGFTPVMFTICCVFAIFDFRIFKHNRKIKQILWPLCILFFALFFASFLNLEQYNTFPINYLLKLLAVEAGFYIMSLYFIEYPQILKVSMLIYAYTCVIIIFAFFGGFLKSYSFVSKGRLWIFGENPNTFSFLMSLGAIILANKYNNNNNNNIGIRIFDIIAITSILLYIVLSGSRGSFLIVVVCMIILFFNKKMLKKSYITIPVVLFIFVAGTYYYNIHQEEISIFDRLTRTADDERKVLQKQSFELFLERPLIGYGINGYKGEMMRRHHESRDSHNVAVTTLAMSGIIGFSALTFFLFYLIRISWKKKSYEILSFVFCIDVLLMSMKTGGVLTFTMMWYSYAMVVALAIPQNNTNRTMSPIKNSFLI